MKLTKTDINEIQKLINDGLIHARKHPSLPLTILNYSNLVQYNFLWNKYTEMCRGLIVDDFGNIISNPFPKFYTIGHDENDFYASGREKIKLPETTPEAFEKLDGSLGIQYIFNNNWGIASRGSFDSEMANFANSWMNERYSIDDFNPEWTYLYEIIYPENRIIVNYGDRKELVLIAIRETETGKELNYIPEAKRLGLNYAKSYPFNLKQSIEEVKKFNGFENEGFVVKYPCGFRVKVKSPDYLIKHKTVTNLDKKQIISLIIDNKIEELLNEFPDEYFPDLHKITNEIHKEKEKIIKNVNEFIENLPVGLSNKEIAELAKGRKDINVIFAKLNGKEINNIILKGILQ